MRSVLLILSLVLLTLSQSIHYELREEWQAWKTSHRKNYTCHLNELERHLIWLSNKKYIESHNTNADYLGFSLAMNSFGDLTDTEYLEKFNGFVMKEERLGISIRPFQMPPHYNGSSLPQYIDWKKKGVVTKVKKQKSCRSCYAFSAVGALESAVALATNKLVYLSEQNIVDCSGSFGNLGCSGGDTISAFKYIIANGGIDKASYYPYKAKVTDATDATEKGQCKFNKNYIGAKESGVVAINYGSESDLKAAVALNGPISVAVDARSSAFRFYRSGVFRSYQCSSSTLTHAMLLTGYGSKSGRKYWTLKNSWGTKWGSSGYMLLSRDNNNHCGIASHSFYPTL